MKRVPILVALWLAAACGTAREEPALNQHQKAVEKMLAESKAQMEADPCMRRRGDVWEHAAPSKCLEFLPPQRMRGVWITGFEESGFIPGVEVVPLERRIGQDSANPEFDILLEIDHEAVMRQLGQPERVPHTRAVAIEFIGRRSREPGAYYTSEGNHVIVVDRLLSARLLGRVWTRIEIPGCEGECAGPR